MCFQFYPDAICHPNGGSFCCLAPVDIWLIRFYSLSAAGGKSLVLGGAGSHPPPALIHLSLSISLSIPTHLTVYLFFNLSPEGAEGLEFQGSLTSLLPIWVLLKRHKLKEKRKKEKKRTQNTVTSKWRNNPCCTFTWQRCGQSLIIDNGRILQTGPSHLELIG